MTTSTLAPVISVEVELDRQEPPGLDHRVVVYFDVPGYGRRAFRSHPGSREHCDDVRDRMLGNVPTEGS